MIDISFLIVRNILISSPLFSHMTPANSLHPLNSFCEVSCVTIPQCSLISTPANFSLLLTISTDKVLCMLNVSFRSADLQLCTGSFASSFGRADCACCKSRVLRVGVWATDVSPSSLHITIQDYDSWILCHHELTSLVEVFLNLKISYVLYFNLCQNRHVSHKKHKHTCCG